ncbi:MAG: hypothetical protein ACJZ7A_03325 [Opitutales bacterium]
MKTLQTSILLASLMSHSLLGQDAAKVQSRIEGTDRQQPAPLTGKTGGAQDSSGADAAASDTGAQRPISLKKDGISAFFGYDSKYFYRSNPLAQKGDLEQVQTAMWTNTFFGGAGLGIIETDDSVITPYVGASWTVNDYTEANLGQFNYNSTTAYALLLAQYGNGWSARIGVNYANDRSTEFDTEDYSEFFPNVGVMKAFSINEQTTGIFDAFVGQHSTTIASIGSNGEDLLDNFEIAASYGIRYKQGDLTISPKYLLSYKTFENGSNSDRDDTTHNLSLKADYPLAESFDLGFFAAYTLRDSSVSTNEYKNLDSGVGLTLNARF